MEVWTPELVKEVVGMVVFGVVAVVFVWKVLGD